MPLPLLAFISLLPQAAVTTGPLDPIEKPFHFQSYGGFYTKRVRFQGMPIFASNKVDDRALRTIVATFEKMLANTPKEVMASLVAFGCHYSIIAEEEGQTDLPEYADLRSDPNMDWNKRARGLGGKYTSGGEENILELKSDRYVGESIFIHEFAHTLDEFGFSKTDPKFRSELRDAYSKAMAEGLWKNTYAATNPAEYWAEGVQSYFDCNRSATPSNGIHNDICDRESLRKYDPRLFALIDRSFGNVQWTYQGKYNSRKR